MKRTTRKLGLEALENKYAPACTVNVIDGHILQITGDATDNEVSIVQNDTANKLYVTCDGALSIYTSSAIDKIDVKLKGGVDTFDYGLSSFAFTHEKELKVGLGGGDDTARIDMWHGIGNDALLQSSLKISLEAGAGNDNVDADFGRKHGGLLSFKANLGDGTDFAAARMWGDMSGGTDVDFELCGGEGNDTLSTWNTFDNVDYSYNSLRITGDSTFDVLMKGEGGNDHLNATYGGELDGDLSLILDGGKGNDNLNMSKGDNCGIKLLDGSSGELDVQLLGRGGDDFLVLSITEDDPGDAWAIDALMDGGGSYDTWNWLATTSNVDVINMEHAVPVLVPI